MNDGNEKTEPPFPAETLGSICHFSMTVIVTLSSVTQLALAWIDHLEGQRCMANKWDNTASYTAALIEGTMLSCLEEN